jgi:UDPglucose 6-dehydrogenase
MFSTVVTKTIAMLGFAFKKDTDNTSEVPVVTDACRGLLGDKACLHIFDPHV